jgi:hypothetical protein
VIETTSFIFRSDHQNRANRVPTRRSKRALVAPPIFVASFLIEAQNAARIVAKLYTSVRRQFEPQTNFPPLREMV